MARTFVILLAILLSGVAWPDGADRRRDSSTAASIFEGLNAARRAADVAPLRAEAAVEKAARRLAEDAASRPPALRLASHEPAETYMRGAGLRRFSRAWEYMAIHSGGGDEAAAALEYWRAYGPAWQKAMDPVWAAAGVATARTEDGALVIVVVFLEPEKDFPPVASMEDRTVEAINAERARVGLLPLAVDPRLTAIARAHSEDMARRGFFGHDTPEGIGPDDRVREFGVAYQRLAENVLRTVHSEDPVVGAVEGWLGSESHRRNIFNADFTRTGVGIAIDDEGGVVFSQLFLARGAGAAPEGRHVISDRSE